MFGFAPDPILLHIGPLTVRWYGVLIALGTALAATASARLARRWGYDPEHIWSALIWCLGLGILGARIQYVLTSSLESPAMRQYYLEDPVRIIATWQGGLGIYGALLGGILGLALYARRADLALWRWANFVIVGVPLGQAIGRWGNFFNQELYGAPTDLPWAVTIDPANRLPGYESFATFHPVFLYESLWNLIGFALLFWLGWRYGDRLLDGELVGLYAIWYPTGRFLIEFIRLGYTDVAGLTPAQWASLIAIVIGAFITVYRRTVRVQLVRSQ
ncbi:MAG: prolipoprotein diacylglyceryl transferase [Chloroflexi bacterium]|nr:prolipoprotein diacylglyceryl transferase [Chloroflexota bacterium]